MDDLDILRTDDFDAMVVPTKWYMFEVMDRASMLLNHIDDALCNHPGLDEEHARKAQQAMNLIMDIYQYAGVRFFEMTKDEE